MIIAFDVKLISDVELFDKIITILGFANKNISSYEPSVCEIFYL